MSPLSPPPARCKRHPTATAGWRCVGCADFLCPECVEARRISTVDLIACRACGQQAETLLVHRSRQQPLAERMRTAVRYLLNRHALAMLLAIGTILTLLAFLTRASFILARLAPAVLLFGVFWGCFFAILRASARGETDIPLPEYNDLISDWLQPSLRGLVATSAVWLPFGVYLVCFSGWDAHAYISRLSDDPMFYATGTFHALPWEQLREDPIVWVLGLAGLVYLPMGLIQGAIGAPFLEMINPVRGVRAMLRLGRDYTTTLGVLFVLGLAGLVTYALGASLRALDLGLLTRWLAELVELPVPLLMAHVLGLLLHTRGDALGYGASSEYLTPVLPGAAPSTTLRVEGLGLPEAETAPPPELRIQELTQAVSARDIPRALALYAEIHFLPRAALPPAVHLFVGQAAASQQQHALAVRALEAAADSAPEDPLAPRALVLLARVLGERMQEPGRAQEVYRYIVERYPDTDASRFARVRLPPTS
ncbi:hypothetical protein CYFUS_002862 [Cystobacter fuscus]|uniref:B box-type domain-containing protein n=1 Tax=Cystobacter fuscus TaxID=43 RepID=A0A250J1N7_9BACT|nr:hypothetical protein [Cystobacter fuscus]ATB37440.1 hypothetical protein CYFUS_002862 [Cystobacter fuscus]